MPVKMKPSGYPGASQARWILVNKLERERAMAWAAWPPARVAPCACTRIAVLSIMRLSSSRCAALSPSQIAFHRPFLVQARNRSYTDFQRPNAVGRSRQGAPVRKIQRIASIFSRRFPQLRPRLWGPPRLSRWAIIFLARPNRSWPKRT